MFLILNKKVNIKLIIWYDFVVIGYLISLIGKLGSNNRTEKELAQRCLILVLFHKNKLPLGNLDL
jgi:hypothetical protein